MTWALTHPSTEASARALEGDHADREDDPTPRGVVRAAIEAVGCSGIDAVSLYTRGEPLRVLDVCAGYGAWASEFRRYWTRTRDGIEWPVHITGVELFEPRRADLEKWCDEVNIGGWRLCLNDGDPLGCETWPRTWDLVIGNPHFTALTHEDPEQSMPAVLLRHAPAVLLLHTQQAFARGEAGRRVWRAYPPAASWVVPGSVKFRNGVNPKCPKCGHVNALELRAGDYVQTVSHCLAKIGETYDGYERMCGARLKSWGSDQRCYQVSLWLRGHSGPTALHLLPELPASARRWTVPPGSEEPSDELPAAPGWSP